MIDHVGFAVSDYERGKSFYTQALAPLGYALIMEVDAAVNASGFPAAGFGIGRQPDFWIGGEGKLESPCTSRSLPRTVRPWTPSTRPYSDGHNIEAVCHAPA